MVYDILGSFGNNGHRNQRILILKTNMRIGYLITPYEASNKPEKAKEWRAKLSETEAKTE
jgi:hypothetical protein